MSVAQVPAARQRWTLAAACLSVMLAQATFSMPGALNGTFQTVFHTQGSELTWITAAFTVPMVIFELTAGVMGDLYGRKRLLLGGAVLVVVGSIISFLSQDVHVMWIGQVFCGLGAASLFPTSLAIVASTAPNHAARSRGIAIWAGFLSIGAVVAPILAGVFVKYASWRDGYLTLVAIAILAFGTIALARDSSAPEGRKLDIPGQLTLAIGLFAILYGLNQGAAVGWGKTNIIVAFIVGVIVLGLFVVIELRTQAPLLRLNLFRNRAFAVTGFTAVVGMFSYLGIAFGMSIFLGAVQHQSALRIGLIFPFLGGPAFLMAPIASYLIRNVSPRWTLSLGYLLMAAGGFWLSTFGVHDMSTTRFFAPIFVVGVGFGLTIASLTAVAVQTVPVRLAGMASATTNMLRDLGFALGPVIVGAVAVSAANSKLHRGLGAALAGVHAPYSDIAAGISHSGGALAINSLPVIPGPTAHSAPLAMPAALHELALNSLGSAYDLGFRLCAICAVVAAGLVLVGLTGVRPVSADADITSGVDLIDGIAVPTDGHAAVV